MAELFGLIDSSLKQPVPLEKISVDVKIKGSTGSIQSNFTYFNKGENPIEAAFVFPLEDRFSVCGFQVKVEDRIIKGKVVDEDKAWDIYDDAISAGQTAFRLQASHGSSDVFKISVGNLPSKASAEIHMECIGALKISRDGSISFTLPIVMNPRYSRESHTNEIKTDNTNLTVNPPGALYVKSHYQFYFTMHVETGSEIEKIFSETDLKLKVILNNDKRKAIVNLDDDFQLNQDIDVIIKQKSPFAAHVFTENGKGEPVTVKGQEVTTWEEQYPSLPIVMINFLPKFEGTSDSSVASEFVFLIDRSGSMSGNRIKSAKEALLLFLKSLPMNSCFDIISFGSSSHSFFVTSQKYSDENLEEACAFVEEIKADMGGTDILQPLISLYNRPKTPQILERNIFLLTDGEVSNTQEVINLVKSKAAENRCFTLGIGDGASSALVHGVAKAGRGKSDFVRNNERVQKKVIGLLQNACTSRAGNIKVTWDLPNNTEVKQIPDDIGSVFDGDVLTVYGIIMNTNGNNVTGNVTLEYEIHQKHHKENLTFSLESNTKHDAADVSNLHALAANEYFLKLYQQPHFNWDRMIMLSEKSGVLSQHTQYIAVDEGTNKPVKGPLIMFWDSSGVQKVMSDAPSKSKTPVPQSDSASLLPLPPGAAASPKTNSPPAPGLHNAATSLPTDSVAEKPTRSINYLALVALQTASGKWLLTEKFSLEFGKKYRELSKTKPFYLSHDDKSAVWATALAIACLAGDAFKSVQDELCMIIKKAEQWLSDHLPSDVKYDQVMKDARKALNQF